MSRGRQRSDPFSLTIRDRLPFPQILTEQIFTFQDSILNTEFSQREIEESIEGFINLIPSRWEDEQFKKDVKAAYETRRIDIRPKFAGVPKSLKLCKEQGIKVSKTIKIPNHFKLLKAGIDLLERLGMVSRREITEKTTGIPEGEEILPEGMTLDEYIESLGEELEEGDIDEDESTSPEAT